MKLALAAIAIARMLDAGSTCVAIGHGGVDSNPVFQTGCRTDISVQDGTSTAQDWALSRMAKEHPTRAKVFAWITVGVESAIVYHNMGVR